MTRKRSGSAAKPRSGLSETVRRAFDEFLALPTFIIGLFALLAGLTYWVDTGDVGWIEPLRSWVTRRLFVDASATADLLSTIAGGIITVTSITISLLLIALQQVAGSLTAEVYDQFLRRRHNQAYFGFFVGLALFTLLVLTTVNDGFNPVMGASAAVFLTGVAMYLLIVLLYTTINQMRPEEVIHEIQRLTLESRDNQLKFLEKTLRQPRLIDAPVVPVLADDSGYVARIDLDRLDTAVREAGGAGVEIRLHVSMGTYVAFGDVIASVTSGPDAADSLDESVRRALSLERQRNLPTDPANGIGQLEMIAWTSISTAKSDPGPGLLTIHALRDLLARGADQDDVPPQQVIPVIYEDNYNERLLDAFESLGVVATESMQHQSFGEILRAFTLLFDRLPPDQQMRVEDIILRLLSGLGDHILTARLDGELQALARALENAGRTSTASAVAEAREVLGRSVGEINSRATRIK